LGDEATSECIGPESEGQRNGKERKIAGERLFLDLPDDVRDQRQAACAELDRLCDEFPIESQGPHLTRDQLHERH
jgi:hypothetical protein